jgi:hypothetical protein
MADAGNPVREFGRVVRPAVLVREGGPHDYDSHPADLERTRTLSGLKYITIRSTCKMYR